MLYCIAELITAIPEKGGLSPLFRDYLYLGEATIDIEIDPSKYNSNRYVGKMTPELLEYLESGRQFFSKLVDHSGIYLHASSVAYGGKGYLFSADSGTGKSTHTKLWKQVFGEEVKIFNDDKTPVRRLDGVWYAYGAPWCGKDNININMKVPVSGICFLKQGSENKIYRLSQREAIIRIINQTLRRSKSMEKIDLMLSHVEKIVKEIPVFELVNRPEPEAAWLSYETMRKAAEEIGL